MRGSRSFSALICASLSLLTVTASAQQRTLSAYFEGPSLNLGNCWTISNSTDDNGALACARGLVQGHRGNGTTVEAINNLLICAPSLATTISAGGVPTLVIDGHGAEGIITTGIGQGSSGWDSAKYVATWNGYIWEPEFNRLRNHNFAILTLVSCDTGAGEEGADLLYRLATILNRPVRARTGLTYCGGGGFSFEPNSTWQVANPPPAPRPTPIRRPTHPFVKSDSINRGTQKLIQFKTITAIELVNLKALRGAHATQPESLTLTQDEVRSLLGMVAFGFPYQVHGVPLAIPTARISLRYGEEPGATVVYTVYNDRILADDSEPRNYYNTQPGFDTLLQDLLR